MKTVLQKKLKEVIKNTGMTLIEIANKTGVSKENMYKWYKGTRPSDSYIFNKLNNFLDDILNDVSEMGLKELDANHAIRDGAGHDYISQRDLSYMVKIPFKNNLKLTPLINKSMDAGNINFNDDEPGSIAIHIDAPFFGNAEGIVEVTGSSMEPTFQNGCLIAIYRLKNRMIHDWGAYYYIVDISYERTLRRVYQGPSNNILLVSESEDQEKYPPIVREWDQIETIFKVKAVIQKL